MLLQADDARELAAAALRSIGFSDADAAVTADHLVDAGLRGVTFGSLPRILSIAERMAETGDRRKPVTIVKETENSAVIDGGDNVGYVVAHRATTLVVEKAKRSGIAVVGAHNTYLTGLFSYYIEMATREGLVAMAAGNTSPLVAPAGVAEPLLGTNPIAFGFPGKDDPFIWDVGMAAMMKGDMILHQRLGQPLPAGVALDAAGLPTTDPARASAITSWGGHRGSGLAMVVQLLGAICGTLTLPQGLEGFGFFILAFRPDLLSSREATEEAVAGLRHAVHTARPRPGEEGARTPFERSAAERRRRLTDGIEVPDAIYRSLCKMAGRPTPG
jgi:LDH2 family malate/lactate/ureidoglycolate dehydrogenase